MWDKMFGFRTTYLPVEFQPEEEGDRSFARSAAIAQEQVLAEYNKKKQKEEAEMASWEEKERGLRELIADRRSTVLVYGREWAPVNMIEQILDFAGHDEDFPIQEGCTVKLKSGGPLMVVDEVEPSGDICRCKWYRPILNDYMREGFKVSTLELA